MLIRQYVVTDPPVMKANLTKCHRETIGCIPWNIKAEGNKTRRSFHQVFFTRNKNFIESKCALPSIHLKHSRLHVCTCVCTGVCGVWVAVWCVYVWVGGRWGRVVLRLSVSGQSQRTWIYKRQKTSDYQKYDNSAFRVSFTVIKSLNKFQRLD